jgi:hypothetical protein
MLANRMMRGEEGSEFQTRHGFSLRDFVFVELLGSSYEVGPAKAIAETI